MQNVVKSIEKQTRKQKRQQDVDVLPLQDRTAEHLNRMMQSSESKISSGGQGGSARGNQSGEDQENRDPTTAN